MGLAFGMELVARSGPGTGNRDHHARVLRSGAARFVVMGAHDPASPLAAHHRAHWTTGVTHDVTGGSHVH